MKTSAPPSELIEVHRLRVGMFVHLNLRWMAHPFPLGSFRITSEEQIATIRSIGVTSVRWSPAQSDPTFERRGNTLPGAFVESPMAPAWAGAMPRSAEPAAARPESDAAVARQACQRVHARPRAGLQHCERQFAEAARDLRQLIDAVATRPTDARAGVERLAATLRDRMLGDHDLGITLLSDAAADKASAHALNVAVIALLMGRTFGLADEEMLDLGVGALLHDIGNLEVSDRVGHADDPFAGASTPCDEEHVVNGMAQSCRMGLAPGAALVIAQHHEHADGSGFPLRLNSDRMTTAGRIVALVDRYDQLCNPDDPARTLTPHESISLLFTQGKTAFDTAILGAFIRMMGVYPAGSTVQLTDDRYAMVVGVNSSRPLRPRVLVHEAKIPREEAKIVDLESAHGLGIRRSIKPLQLPPAVLDYLAPPPRVSYYFEAVGHAAERSWPTA